ncbi:MAG: hypothetical protein WCK09_14045 [Bacteroidota bacterium]
MYYLFLFFGLSYKSIMETLIRFKIVEIDSKISFNGKKKKTLKYPVRSVSLIPEPKSLAKMQNLATLPEIFWQ